WQCGHRGLGGAASAFGFRGGRKALLLEATQHSERASVYRPWLRAPAGGIPSLPAELHLWRFGLQLRFEPRLQLGRAHGELSFLVKRCRVAVGRAEPFD